MSLLLTTALIGVGAFLAGLLGSLTGLGGGIVIVPLLTLAFGADIRYAVGASLVAVIATSSGAGATYVKEGFTNIRVGMLLEVATVTGALGGAYLATVIPANAIAILFAVMVLFAALQSLRPGQEDVTVLAGPLARRLRLGSSYPTERGPVRYEVRRVPLGLALMGLAGVLSALLGIGSGVVKVLAMDRAMGLPFKVSTTTSNFMMGVTAAASAGIYLQRGYINPVLTFPVLLGVLAGASTGARLLSGAPTRALRLLFTGAVVLLALELLYKGVSGGL
jgi:uncharacterized membrane protein YfcA